MKLVGKLPSTHTGDFMNSLNTGKLFFIGLSLLISSSVFSAKTMYECDFLGKVLKDERMSQCSDFGVLISFERNSCGKFEVLYDFGGFESTCKKNFGERPLMVVGGMHEEEGALELSALGAKTRVDIPTLPTHFILRTEIERGSLELRCKRVVY